MLKKIVIPVVFVTAFLSGNGQAVSQAALSKEQTGMVIHSLAAVLQQNYVFPDTALSMVNLLEARFRQGAYDSSDRPGLLAAELNKDLWSIYHDGHLRVRYDPKLAASIGKGTELGAADKKNALDYTRQLNFGFNRIEILEGNIGYLKLNMFAEVNPESKEVVEAAFRFLQHVRVLVIDLRENGGGDPEMIQYVCNYLFPKRTHLNDIYERRSNTTSEFWTIPDRQLTSLMEVPIYILTSKTSFSGAEEFAYDLQTQHRGVVVGEVTGGGAHPVEPRAVSNGFVLFVPFARAINPITETNWEGKGVQPDIKTTADKALDVALEQIRMTPKSQ